MNKEYEYYDCDFYMTSKDMENVMRALLYTHGQLLDSYNLGAEKYYNNKKQLRHFTVFTRIRLEKGSKDIFEAISGITLKTPAKIANTGIISDYDNE